MLSEILIVLVLLWRVDAYHCRPPFSCESDSDTLFPTILRSQKYSYKSLSHCADPTHCDDSTKGTGHQLYNSLSEDVVSVERCYSFCFLNVMPSIVSDGGDEVSFVFKSHAYSGNRCGGQLKEAHVCYSACLFWLKELNPVSQELITIMSLQGVTYATCARLCSGPRGICKRALPRDASRDCKKDCRTNVCPAVCQRVENSFPRNASESPLKYGGFFRTASLNFPENITLQKEGVMEYSIKYGIYPPWVPIPLSDPPLSQSKAYGLVWRVSSNISSEEQFQYYIPQHLPIFLLDQENELFRSGPNLLAIRSLQCKSMKVEFAIVDENRISSFVTASESTCFKGSWFPRPPGGFSTRFGFLQSTSDLAIEFQATELSPDDALVEEYRIQILSGYQSFQSNECQAIGNYGQLIADEKLERTGNGSLMLQVKTEYDVKRFFPVYWRNCRYLILVYATPQQLQTASGRIIYPRGNLNIVSVPFPYYDYIVLDASYTLEWNNVTGRVDVYIHVVVTSHWTSLAVLSRLGGVLFTSAILTQPQRSFIPVTATNSTFDIPYHSVTPHQPGEDHYYLWVPEFLYRYPRGGVRYPQDFSLKFPINALPPGAVRNFSVIEQFKPMFNQLILNVSWMRPVYPQGKVKFYHLLVSSANILVIIAEKISPQDHGEDVVFEHQIVIDLVVNENITASIITETEYGVKGDWQVITIENYMTDKPTCNHVCRCHCKNE